MARQRDYSTLLAIISGERTGFVAGGARFVLWTLTPIYRLGVWWRNRGFDSGRLKIETVDVPVISVGNLTTGGTGKTPFVIWLAQWIRQLETSDSIPGGNRVAIVSRGYGANQDGVNDEGLEIEQRLPDVPHLQDSDRFKMALTAVNELESQVILLDDGFQHRQLERSLDIVLIDATHPFGFGYTLPRGLLREPMANLQRADVIVITRSDLVQPEKCARIRKRIELLNSNAVWCESRTRPTRWVQAAGQSASLDELSGKRLFAMCAIGNPDGFVRTISEAGFQPSSFQSFPDHHHFSRAELESIAIIAKQEKCDAIVCTVKDLVKIGVNRLGGIPVWAFQVDIEFTDGQKDLERIIIDRAISKIAADCI